ncbi:polyprenyl synthetase family protein [archaeon]|nr:MAG: polyprenyl synthetase family protein [archaeon]
MVLQDRLSQIRKIVNKEIEKISKGTELYDAALHIIRSGGKRLRPFLAITTSELMGGSLEIALPAAVSLELLHNFTLIHDDIMDRDDFRHGVPTVHKMYGVPTAILSGDLLFAFVFKNIISSYADVLPPNRVSKIVEKLSEVSIQICEGAWMDMTMEGKKVVPEEIYLEMISKKTAALFEASTYCGAITATEDVKMVKNASSFGYLIGMAFQIVDDILGMVGDPKKTGKPVGSDLRNGKATIIVLHAYRNMSRKDALIVDRVFGKPSSEEDLREAVKIIERCGSISYAKEKAKFYIENAKAVLSEFDESPSRTILMELANFIHTRIY